MFSFGFPSLVTTINCLRKSTTFGIINYHFACKTVIKSLLILDLCRKIFQKSLTEKKLLPVKAFKSTLSEIIKLYFHVEISEQIKSTLVVLNLKTFESTITQVGLVPIFCSILILLNKRFLVKLIMKKKSRCKL